MSDGGPKARAWSAQDRIFELRTELDVKDQRIAELEREIRWAIMEYRGQHDEAEAEMVALNVGPPDVCVAMSKKASGLRRANATTKRRGERITELEARIDKKLAIGVSVGLREHLADAEALIRRTAADSVVTTSDEPGCFYCDHEEHTDDCPAAKWLAERGK